MIPTAFGYYWVKSFDYDGTGGKSISDWYLAWYDEGNGWVGIGDEYGMREDSVVEIGLKIEEPDK